MIGRSFPHEYNQYFVIAQPDKLDKSNVKPKFGRWARLLNIGPLKRANIQFKVFWGFFLLFFFVCVIK